MQAWSKPILTFLGSIASTDTSCGSGDTFLTLTSRLTQLLLLAESLRGENPTVTLNGFVYLLSPAAFCGLSSFSIESKKPIIFTCIS